MKSLTLLRAAPGTAAAKETIKKRLRQMARPLWRRYLQVERRLLPSTPLDPLFHIRLFGQRTPSDGKWVDIGGGGSPYRDAIAESSDLYLSFDIVARSDTSVVGDAHAMGLRCNSVKGIILTEVLEHLHSPWLAVRELARILEPGGVVVVTVPQYWHVHGWPSDYYRYTHHGLRHLFEEAGLSLEVVNQMGGPFQLIYSALFLNIVPWIRRPVVSILAHGPLLWLTWKLDQSLFKHNLERRNPDTRGWAALVRKPREEEQMESAPLGTEVRDGACGPPSTRTSRSDGRTAQPALRSTAGPSE